MPENRALWLPRATGHFSVGDAPYKSPGSGEVTVRVHAVAVNPVDGIPGVARRFFIMPKLPFPAVMGSDVAGEVVEVGPDVERFTVGDRVVGHAIGQDPARNHPLEGAFQHYVVLVDHMASPIPDSLSFEQAAVLPLALSTAAAGLFERDQLALPFPSSGAPSRDETVLVWGASTSVGLNAVQLARNAGFDVIATASPHNFALLHGLGAAACFDYHEADVVRRIRAHLQSRCLGGALAIGSGSLKRVIAIATASDSGRRVSSAFPGPITGIQGLVARPQGVRVSAIWGGSPFVSPVGPAVYRDFLPSALEDGRFIAAPTASVVGEGLGTIPVALSQLRAGVSAKKLVVRL